MYCQKCGHQNVDSAKFCGNCGIPLSQKEITSTEIHLKNSNGIVCPKCNSNNVEVQLFQEHQGKTSYTQSKTHSKTTKYGRGSHGLLWWICIGWWWWVIDLMIWIFVFIPRLLIQVFSKSREKTKSKTTTVVNEKEHTGYRSMCLCHQCGYHWERL